MSIELLSTEAKNQIIHDALYGYLLSGFDSWTTKIDFYYGLMKNAKVSLPAILALKKEGEIAAYLESASHRFPHFVHWDTVKNKIDLIYGNLFRIALMYKIPTDIEATQDALQHYSKKFPVPTSSAQGDLDNFGEHHSLVERRRDLEVSDSAAQHSKSKNWKSSRCTSAINNFGNFLFKCERPKTRATAGFIIAAAGSGLAYTALTPKLVLMLLGAALTPHVTAALLAVGLFLAAVGTAMFIHGLVTNCRHAKPQSHVLRPDYSRVSIQ